ncbi:MAG TPA: sensor domain-containing protein [Streptosporangiaceae bacterium]|nr:sensor domain-containing protein [Streptosporangiaceae bacterium]
MSAPSAGQLGQSRLTLRLDPVRLLFSASLWRSIGYLIGHLVFSGLLFSITLAVVTTVGVLSFTLFGIPLAIAAAAAVHWCAGVERWRLGAVFDTPVKASYPPLPPRGLLARARACWTDRATWREFAYLIGLFVPLFALDTAVFAIWALFASWITLPLWYWAPWTEYNGIRYHGYQAGFYFPHGPHGPGTVGVFIDTLPKALVAAGIGLVGLLIFNYVVVATARMHARVARAMLRPPADPLAEAKAALTTPGPLGPLYPNPQ